MKKLIIGLITTLISFNSNSTIYTGGPLSGIYADINSTISCKDFFTKNENDYGALFGSIKATEKLASLLATPNISYKTAAEAIDMAIRSMANREYKNMNHWRFMCGRFYNKDASEYHLEHNLKHLK